MIISDWRGNPWMGKLIFLSGNFAAAVVIVLGLVIPIHDFFAARDLYIAEQRALLARLRSIAAQEPNIQAAARQVAEEEDREEFVLGPNEGVINADLQTQLKSKATQSGAQLRSAQILPPRTIEGVRFVGSRLDILGPIQAVHRAIYTIESGRPYHFITDAVIKPSAPANVQRPPKEPVVEARLDVFVAIHISGNRQ